MSHLGRRLQSAAHVSASQSPSLSSMRLMIPAYFDPTATNYWNQAITAASGVKPDVMIANSNNGPGTSKQSSYVTAIQNAQENGVMVIGYVATGYGTQTFSPDNQIFPIVDQWFSWYSVNGIFFDECSTNTNQETYYKGLVDYVKNTYGSTKFVALNPGVAPDEGYMNIGADVVCIEENTYSSWGGYSPPPWIGNYTPDKYCMLTYGVSTLNNMQAQLNLIASYGVQWVYITDDTGSNPWDTLPGVTSGASTYYDLELTTARDNAPEQQ